MDFYTCVTALRIPSAIQQFRFGNTELCTLKTVIKQSPPLNEDYSLKQHLMYHVCVCVYFYDVIYYLHFKNVKNDNLILCIQTFLCLEIAIVIQWKES